MILFYFLRFSLLKCRVPVKPVKKNKVIIHTISFWLAKRSGRWNGSQTEKQRRPSLQHPQQPAPSIIFKKTQPQQLTAKTEECRHLTDRLDAIEEVNGKILRSQMLMQENFVKVIPFLNVV